MDALVTGATGHLGSHVVRELLERGAQVRVLVRPGADTRALDRVEKQHGPVQRVEGDLLDPPSLRAALDGVEILYQVASLHRYDVPLSEMRRVNVHGVGDLLQAAEESGVARVVFTSSSVTVGSGTRRRPADESRSFDLGRLGGAYVRTKCEAEELAFACSERGLDVVVVNPSYVLGPGDFRGTPSTATVVRVLRRQLPGVATHSLSPVDVRDVARGHVLAAQHGKPGARYLLAGQNVRLRQLFRLIQQAGGTPAPRLPIPSPVARLAALGYEGWGRLRGRSPLVTGAEASLTARSFCFDCGRAQRELGYTFRPARAVVEDTVSWCREMGWA